MLQAERTSVTRQLIVLKRRIRRDTSEVENLKRRLRDITESEDYLSGGDR